jgi:hypothetical protein
MNHQFVPPTVSNATAPCDRWVWQSYDSIYTYNGCWGRKEFAAAAAAEAATTAAVAALAAANAAQQAASAANAATGISYNYGKQGHRPFPAMRCKVRPDDSWRNMPHQEGWRSSAWDGNRARSHKRQNGYGAERGSLSKSRRVSKQRLQYCSQPQQQWKVRRGKYNGGDAAAEAGRHCTKAKDGSPRSTGGAGAFNSKASLAQHSSGKSKQDAVARVLELHEHLYKQAESVSTQTPPDEAKGSQTEPCLDEAAIELKQELHQYFSLSVADSDDDEAEFFPKADPAHVPCKEQTE